MDSRSIAVITDSTCDFPQTLIDQYNIQVIPQLIIWGTEQYRDRVDMRPHEFYERLKSDKTRPTSSQPAVGDFQDAYVKAAQRGAKEIIMLTVSSALSGTYQMALNAANMVDVPVHVVDSKGPTMSLGFQVLEAARSVKSGMDLPEILNKIETVRKRLVQFVAMETMEYLERGGRMGGAAKWVGTMLSIKPLVSINHQTGLVESESLARSHKQMVELLYRKFFERLRSRKGLHIAVLHGDAQEEADNLAERIRREFDPVELLVNTTGPVLGINTGPGALALCGYAEG